MFRFNRRTVHRRGLLLLRLLERAVAAGPITYSESVANPRPSYGEIAPPPGPRSWSTTLTAQQAGRPWRQAQQLQQPAGLLHLHG